MLTGRNTIASDSVPWSPRWATNQCHRVALRCHRLRTAIRVRNRPESRACSLPFSTNTNSSLVHGDAVLSPGPPVLPPNASNELRARAWRILSKPEGKFEATKDPPIVKAALDGLAVLAQDAIEYHAKQETISVRFQLKVLGWLFADALGQTVPWDPETAFRVGKRLAKRIDVVRAAIAKLPDEAAVRTAMHAPCPCALDELDTVAVWRRSRPRTPSLPCLTSRSKCGGSGAALGSPACLQGCALMRGGTHFPCHAHPLSPPSTWMSAVGRAAGQQITAGTYPAGSPSAWASPSWSRSGRIHPS